MKLNNEQKQDLLQRFNESLDYGGDANDMLNIVKEVLADIDAWDDTVDKIADTIDTTITKSRKATRNLFQKIADKLDD